MVEGKAWKSPEERTLELVDRRHMKLLNDTKALSKIAAIGEALDEMTMHSRGTARRVVLKNRVLELAAEVVEVAYKCGVEEGKADGQTKQQEGHNQG